MKNSRWDALSHKNTYRVGIQLRVRKLTPDLTAKAGRKRPAAVAEASEGSIHISASTGKRTLSGMIDDVARQSIHFDDLADYSTVWPYGVSTVITEQPMEDRCAVVGGRQGGQELVRF